MRTPGPGWTKSAVCPTHTIFSTALSKAKTNSMMTVQYIYGEAILERAPASLTLSLLLHQESA